jgi:hypothetical protein
MTLSSKLHQKVFPYFWSTIIAKKINIDKWLVKYDAIANFIHQMIAISSPWIYFLKYGIW